MKKSYIIGTDEYDRPSLLILIPEGSAKDFIGRQIELAEQNDAWNGSDGFVHLQYIPSGTGRSFFTAEPIEPLLGQR